MIHLPRLNLNGSDPARLIEAHREALEALRTAQDRLAQIAPNGRDYQTGPNADAAHRAAISLHNDRAKALATLVDSITRDMIAIDEATP